MIAIGLLLFTAVPVRPATAAAPVALVYSLAGEATLRVHSGERRPLHIRDRFTAGATVEVGPSSSLALAFANGRRYELGERSRVTLGPADLASRTGPVRPLSSVPPLPCLSPIAATDRPGPRAGAVRIRGERIAGLYPGHGAATLAGATLLRFEPVAGGGRYRVEVQERRGKLIFEVETTASVVTLPAGLLRPGTPYDWSVRTLERAGPVAEGRAGFVTLSARLAAEREALRKALTAEGDGAAMALLAEVDRSLGLLAESRDELRAGPYLQSP